MLDLEAVSERRNDRQPEAGAGAVEAPGDARAVVADGDAQLIGLDRHRDVDVDVAGVGCGARSR